MKVSRFLDFIKESVNINSDGVDFGITYQELEEILIEIEDALPHLTYSIEDASWYERNEYIEDSNNCFMVVFENAKGIEDPDRSIKNDYFLYSEESKITSMLEAVNDKLAIYDLYVREHDFAQCDYEYYLVIAKK